MLDTATAGKPAHVGSGGCTRSEHNPTRAILEALAPVASLTIAELRTRVAADWPTGRLGRTLDLLRERGLIERVRDEIDTYALSIAGRREVGHE